MKLATFATLSAVGCGVALLGTTDPMPASTETALQTIVETDKPGRFLGRPMAEAAVTTHEPTKRPAERAASVAPRTEVVAAVETPVDPQVLRHHAWCDNRYRTYERASATFQPYGDKPRRLCRSPVFRQGLPQG